MPPPTPPAAWRGESLARLGKRPSPEPLPPVGPWRPDFTLPELDEWMKAATADQLQVLNTYGRKVLAGVGVAVLPPASEPMTPQAKARLALIRKKRAAEARKASGAWGGRAAIGSAAAAAARRAAGGFVPTPAQLVTLRRQLGLGQRAAAKEAQISRGLLSDLESGRRRSEARMADVWKAYRQFERVSA